MPTPERSSDRSLTRVPADGVERLQELSSKSSCHLLFQFHAQREEEGMIQEKGPSGLDGSTLQAHGGISRFPGPKVSGRQWITLVVGTKRPSRDVSRSP